MSIRASYLIKDKKTYKMNKRFFILQLVLLLFLAPVLKSQNIEDVKKEENKFIYSDEIKLFPGDQILVEATLNGNQLTDFKRVSTISDSSRTIVFRFSYEKFGSDLASQLRVDNPFSNTLEYKAKIRTEPWRMYSGTSIMPVIRKVYGIEIWPYKIESIILYDFTLRE